MVRKWCPGIVPQYGSDVIDSRDRCEYNRARMEGSSSSAESSTSSAPLRVPGRPFAKGVSGNPGGRPKEIGHVRDLARQHTAAAIRTLVEIMESGKTDSARAAAASELLSRGWGKPSLPIQTEPPQIIVTDEQAAAISVALRYTGSRPGQEE